MRMIEQLTKDERESALVSLLVMFVVGAVMTVAGRADLFSVHGALVMVAALAGIFWVGSGFYAPEPSSDRLSQYYDDPSKVGILLAMGWAVIAMFVGDWVAWQLVNPNLTFDAGWARFGRLRPVYTSGVSFGFGGNALIATSFYVMQRTCRARLPGQLSPWFVLLGYNLFCVIADTGYLMGITQSKEYAEPEWYADIWLVVVCVAFFLTSVFLGMMYYYMPKRAGRPIYSYRMSIISFWGITFFYMWAGSHHLHYTALPQWVQSLGMTISVMLLIPSWVSAGNALMTLNGAWHKVRDDAVLRIMMVAAVFYGLTTFEGSFMAIRPVNALSHYTDWTIGHVHAGALGWVAMITFGAIYASVPWRWKRPAMYSARLVEAHFWLALAGTGVYVFAMWNSGIIQGLMWRTYNESGTLAYSFVDSLVAMHPYYIARAIGGLLFLIGAVSGCYNIWMTIRAVPHVATEPATDRPELAGTPALQPGE